MSNANEKKFNCRLPADLHEEISRLAEQQKRSMNTFAALDDYISRAKLNPISSPDTFNTIVDKLDEMIKIMKGGAL